ncbi:MAG: hypothetical protein WB709_03790 [Solirubrobacteraceae bacterium]
MSTSLNVRIDDELAAWLEAYIKTRRASKTQVVELALRELRTRPPGTDPTLPAVKRRGRKPAERERICYVCNKCIERRFYITVPDQIPECSDHGPMVRDTNDHRASVKFHTGGNEDVQ